ncbi:Transmembrane protein 53 [Ameca splendens]|uniref:Transmembrane protein 53 n=1 Tax=Ameca splendens TaxID=208324 RepID=A0ABV0Y7W3_9TELE
MAADEIDYNIVFPDAGTSERHWQGTKEPVVILLGWAGCKDKHLSKYSSIYNDKAVFSHAAPTFRCCSEEYK